MIEKYIPDIHAAVYFIAGPATMVEALKKILTDRGISEEQISIENFPGY
jgi:ferredoxin-NADP reductase